MNGLVLTFWMLTALGGIGLVSSWCRALRQERRSFDAGEVEDGAITAGKVAPHAALTVGGLLIWAAAATVSDGEPGTAARVLALVMLTAGMAIGVRMFLQWRTGRATTRADGAVPAVVVFAHGLFGFATLVAAVAATLSLR